MCISIFAKLNCRVCNLYEHLNDVEEDLDELKWYKLMKTWEERESLAEEWKRNHTGISDCGKVFIVKCEEKMMKIRTGVE